jgi:uncharacterized protein (DUF1499 family)
MTHRRRATAFAGGIVVIYLIAVASIQLMAPDLLIEPSDFPTACPENSRNCTMIGPNPYRGEGLTELRFDSSLGTVMEEVEYWIGSEPRTEIIGEWPEQTHAVFRTLLWRFPDDFVVNGHCDEGGAVLQVYSKSRLGVGDLGVNDDRVERFVDHMSSIEIATSDCVEG